MQIFCTLTSKQFLELFLETVSYAAVEFKFLFRMWTAESKQLLCFVESLSLTVSLSDADLLHPDEQTIFGVRTVSYDAVEFKFLFRMWTAESKQLLCFVESLSLTVSLSDADLLHPDEQTIFGVRTVSYDAVEFKFLFRTWTAESKPAVLCTL